MREGLYESPRPRAISGVERGAAFCPLVAEDQVKSLDGLLFQNCIFWDSCNMYLCLVSFLTNTRKVLLHVDLLLPPWSAAAVSDSRNLHPVIHNREIDVLVLLHHLTRVNPNLKTDYVSELRLFDLRLGLVEGFTVAANADETATGAPCRDGQCEGGGRRAIGRHGDHPLSSVAGG